MFCSRVRSLTVHALCFGDDHFIYSPFSNLKRKSILGSQKSVNFSIFVRPIITVHSSLRNSWDNNSTTNRIKNEEQRQRIAMRSIPLMRLAEAVAMKSRHGFTTRQISTVSPALWGAAGQTSTNNQREQIQISHHHFHHHHHHNTRNGQQQCRKFTSINNRTSYNICFLRHGQSTWNRDNRFIGWTDTPLTDDGVLEARVAGKMLKNSGILFDEVHTSLLRRCIRTTNLVLMEVEQEYIPVHKVSDTSCIDGSVMNV